MNTRYISPFQAARQLGVSLDVIETLIAHGELPSLFFTHGVRVSDVERVLRSWDEQRDQHLDWYPTDEMAV